MGPCASPTRTVFAVQLHDGRDSNRGACAQPCRYQYALMEEKRPGEYFPVFEDERGTYILNSRDMCMIDHLPDLMEAGVDCIKLEGRAKSAYYAAIVTGAYRHGIDAAAGERPWTRYGGMRWSMCPTDLLHRVLLWLPWPVYGELPVYPPVADLRFGAGLRQYGMATMSLRNKFAAGDTVELVGPDTRPFPSRPRSCREKTART